MSDTINMNSDLMNSFIKEISDIYLELEKAYTAVGELKEGFAVESGTTYQGKANENLSAYFCSMEMHITLLIQLVNVLGLYIQGYQNIMDTVDQETASEITVTN